MNILASVFETVMIITFGLSWPMNLVKAVRSRSTGGKSILYDYFVLAGYLCGVTAKILSGTYNLAFYAYFPNIIMVITDIFLFYRNRSYERRTV